MMISDDNVIDLLAQTLCAAFHSDAPRYADQADRTAWEMLSPRQQGNWRRAAQCALRTINGNRHWMPDGGRLQ